MQEAEMIGATILAACVFLIGLTLAIANSRIKIGDTTTLLAIIVTPLLVLGVASGKIQEFTGPGGVGAKFQEVARARVDFTSVKPVSYERPITQVAKGSSAEFTTGLANIVPGTPITFTFRLAGQTSSPLNSQTSSQRYDLDVAKDQIKTLLSANWTAVVVIARQDGTFLAMAEPQQFYALLNNPSEGPFLIECLNKGQQPPNYPELVFDSLKHEATSNAQALRKMLSYNLQIMAVTNEKNMVDNIAKRDRIVAQLVDQLASQ